MDAYAVSKSNMCEKEHVAESIHVRGKKAQQREPMLCSKPAYRASKREKEASGDMAACSVQRAAYAPQNKYQQERNVGQHVKGVRDTAAQAPLVRKVVVRLRLWKRRARVVPVTWQCGNVQ